MNAPDPQATPDHVTDDEYAEAAAPETETEAPDGEQAPPSPEDMLAAIEAAQQQGPIITKEVTYLGLAVAVRDTEDGLGKQLVFLDQQTGTAHIFPFPNEAAKQIGAKLSSSIEVPEGLVLPD